MPTKSVVVGSAVGLHARPAAIISEAAGELDSEVTIGVPGDEPVDASSALLIMTLGAGKGDTVEVSGRRPGGRGRHRRAGREGPRRLSEDVPSRRPPQAARLQERPSGSLQADDPRWRLRSRPRASRRTISVSRSGLVARLRRACPASPGT